MLLYRRLLDREKITESFRKAWRLRVCLSWFGSVLFCLCISTAGCRSGDGGAGTNDSGVDASDGGGTQELDSGVEIPNKDGAVEEDERLLFYSELEGNVSVVHPQPSSTSQWRLYFEGFDDVTGYDWTSDFPQDEDFPPLSILCLVRGSSELIGDDPARIEDPHGDLYGTTGFVNAQVVEHPGIHGEPNRVLKFHAWRDDPEMAANSRLQANWIPPEHMRLEGGEIYVAYWLKLQPNLYEVHTAYADPGDWHSRWRNIMEWRHDQDGCADANYRFSLLMETYGSEYVFWRLGKDDWSVDTRDRPDLTPPVDRWFFLEVYTLRHPTQGRVWVGVNGMTLFDAVDVPTMPPTGGCYNGILYYQFLKLYGDLFNYQNRIERDRPPYQFWQYYDGIRLYDGLPYGHCAIDGSCPEAADL